MCLCFTHSLWDAPALLTLPKTKKHCIPSSHQTGSKMQGSSAQRPHPPPQLHMPGICIVQRQSSHEEEAGSVFTLCLNHIKMALCNFLNNLTRAAPTETDHALCPNIEPSLPNGRESKHFISHHTILALYCLANIIIAFNNFPLGASKTCCSSAIIIEFVFSFVIGITLSNAMLSSQCGSFKFSESPSKNHDFLFAFKPFHHKLPHYNQYLQ